VFSIAAPTHVYYVNGGAVNATGDWTTAAGNDANDGLTPATPKASIRPVLEAYDLNPGDVIRVDDGTYNLSANLVIGNADSGVTIEGYYDEEYPDRRALVNRGNTSAGSYAIDLQDADRVTLDRLHLTAP